MRRLVSTGFDSSDTLEMLGCSSSFGSAHCYWLYCLETIYAKQTLALNHHLGLFDTAILPLGSIEFQTNDNSME